MNREGTLHIVRVSVADRYQIGFADYASPGGAMKMKEILGEQALRDFFTSIGVQPNIAESALRGLRAEGSANVLNVVLPEAMLINLGLVDIKEQQFVFVRFSIFNEPNGPVLAYCLASPFMPATFSSKAGVRYPSNDALAKALDDAGLPGRRIVSGGGQSDETFTVSGAQLAQLGFRSPASAMQHQFGVVQTSGLRKRDIERLDLVELAVLCQRVADNSTVDADTAERAWQLKREWIVLVARETPPPRHVREMDEIQAQKAELKNRMVEFLSTTL